MVKVSELDRRLDSGDARTVADLIESEWGNLPIVQDLRDPQPTELPRTMVARDPLGGILASASLMLNDLPDRTDLSPWLGCVLVRPERRRLGLGLLLSQSVLVLARLLEYRVLYLFCEPALCPFYKQLRFRVFGDGRDSGKAVTIMKAEL